MVNMVKSLSLDFRALGLIYLWFKLNTNHPLNTYLCCWSLAKHADNI